LHPESTQLIATFKKLLKTYLFHQDDFNICKTPGNELLPDFCSVCGC
jgi:hypothetical protein